MVTSPDNDGILKEFLAAFSREARLQDSRISREALLDAMSEYLDSKVSGQDTCTLLFFGSPAVLPWCG